MCVANVADALAALRETRKFDLAMLDVMLSSAGDSLALAAVLSQQRTPFIFLTGLRAEDVQHTTKFLHTPVVEKPFNAQVLLKALAQALALR